MGELTRYKVKLQDYDEADDGQFVRYEEHLAVVENYKADADRLAGLLVKHLADNPNGSPYNCFCDLCTETRATLAEHEAIQ